MLNSLPRASPRTAPRSGPSIGLSAESRNHSAFAQAPRKILGLPQRTLRKRSNHQSFRTFKWRLLQLPTVLLTGYLVFPSRHSARWSNENEWPDGTLTYVERPSWVTSRLVTNSQEGHLLSFWSDKAIPGTDQKCEVCNLRVSNPQSFPFYSCLSASIGCTPAARRAGIQLAASPTITNRIAPPTMLV